MATRQEIQMAIDLVKFTNVAQDLFNEAVSLARGEKLKQVKVNGSYEQQPMTVDDIKTNLLRSMENIQRYNNSVLKFLVDSGRKTLATNGLVAWGIDVDTLINDNQDMISKLTQVTTDAGLASTQSSLDAIGDFIEVNIPNLLLVRKV